MTEIIYLYQIQFGVKVCENENTFDIPTINNNVQY